MAANTTISILTTPSRPGRKENTSRAVTARVKSTWRVISEYSLLCLKHVWRVRC